MRIIELYQNISSRLSGVTNSEMESTAEAELILSSSLASVYFSKKFSKELLYGSMMNEKVSKDLESFIEYVISKREQNIPLQYILNEAWFYGLKFFVYENELLKTFIPRNETEAIIQESLAFLSKRDKKVSALDIGTGSGVIPISISVNSSLKLQWDAIDLYLTSIPLKNAEYHAVENQINFMKYDISNYCSKNEKKFDLITANLPYVPLESQIDIQVRNEPIEAIYGGDDGLLYINEVLKELPRILNDNGLVIFEIDPSQNKFFQNLKLDYKIKILDDLQGLPRIAMLHS